MTTQNVIDTEDRRAKKLKQVRALLAKADSTQFEAEADTFRQKADELMAQYAIEMFEIGDTHGSQRVEPISRPQDMSWFFDSPRSDEIWALMCKVARHTRVKLVFWTGISYDARSGDPMIPAVGMPADLDYFDMLFTHLYAQMNKGLEPKPQPGESMIEYLVRAKEAGMKWERIGELMLQAGIADFDEYKRNVGVRFTKLYTDYCNETGRARLRTSPQVYQRNYALGFVDGVREKFTAEDKMREQNLNATGVDSSAALALRDVFQIVCEKADELFPRPEVKGRARRGTIRRDTRKYDANAVARGQVAGRTASTTPTGRDSLGKEKGQLNR